MQYVYKIVNKLNGKFYIGRTKHLTTRWNNHKSMLRCNDHHATYLQNAWNKYGEENFEFMIFKIFNTGNENDDLELTIKLEQHFLNTFKIGSEIYNSSSNAVTGALKGHMHPNFNSHPKEWMSKEAWEKTLDFHKTKDVSGENNPFYGKTHSEETKKILSEKCGNSGEKNGFYRKQHSDETKNLLSEKAKIRHLGEGNPFYGKTHSEETKRKISQANKGRKLGSHSEDHKRKMRENHAKSIKIVIDGIEYLSFMDASEKLGINRKTIAKRVRSDKYANYIQI